MFETPSTFAIYRGYAAPSTRGFHPKRAILDTAKGDTAPSKPFIPPNLFELQADVTPCHHTLKIDVDCLIDKQSFGRAPLLNNHHFMTSPDYPYVGCKEVVFTYRGIGYSIGDKGSRHPFGGGAFADWLIELPPDQVIFRKSFYITPTNEIITTLKNQEGDLLIAEPAPASKELRRYAGGGIAAHNTPLERMEPGYISVLFEGHETAAYLERQSALISEGGPLPAPRPVGGYVATFPDIGKLEDQMTAAESLIQGGAHIKLRQQNTDTTHTYRSLSYAYVGGTHHIVNILFKKQ